jgi:hypothetical protein
MLGSRVTIEYPKRARRIRRALYSRRWEKKFCKFLSENTGIRVLAVKKPSRVSCETKENGL